MKTLDTRTFTDKYMPSEELQAMLKGDPNRFLIVPVQEMYRHVHRHVPPTKGFNHTLIFLTEGEVYMKIGNGLYTIHSGEMLIVAAGQVFSFEQYDDSKYNRGFLCHFHDSILEGKIGTGQLLKEFEFLTTWGNPYLPMGSAASFIGQLLKRMLELYSADGLADPMLLQSCLITLLCEMDRVYQPLFPDKQNAGASLTNKFRQLLARHFNTKHRVSEYADLLHVSPNHLNKVVKATTSRSPTHLIDETLLLEAKALLYQTPLSIGEIAAAIGIDDSSYFSRLFKKYEGITPVEYRKMIEKS